MKQAAAKPTTESPRDNASFAIGVVATDFLDTTWRIAVPVVLAATLGIVADKQFGTRPWVTLGMTVIGFGLAALLIKRQLAAVSQREAKR